VKRIGIAALALIAATAAGAQPRTSEDQARTYVWSALMTGAAHAIIRPDVELAPSLSRRLGLEPPADRDKVYEALVTLTRGRLIRVRAATPEEAEPLGGRGAGRALFLVEGTSTALLVAYDLERNQIPLVALAGTPWVMEEPKPLPKVVTVVLAAPPLPRLAEVPADFPRTPFLLKPILFEYRDATLNDEAIHRLEDAGVPKIAAVPGVRYVVRGHSDRLEAEEYKQAISERRAEAVRAYLAGQGVAEQNIQLVGFGASISLTACAQRERTMLVSCLAPDRRVTVEVVPPPK